MPRWTAACSGQASCTSPRRARPRMRPPAAALAPVFAGCRRLPGLHDAVWRWTLPARPGARCGWSWHLILLLLPTIPQVGPAVLSAPIYPRARRGSPTSSPARGCRAPASLLDGVVACSLETAAAALDARRAPRRRAATCCAPVGEGGRQASVLSVRADYERLARRPRPPRPHGRGLRATQRGERPPGPLHPRGERRPEPARGRRAARQGSPGGWPAPSRPRRPPEPRPSAPTTWRAAPTSR